MPNVRCSVDSCHYWGEGDVCTADEIWVKNNMEEDVDDEIGTGRGDMEVGDLGSLNREGRRRVVHTSARTSAETCCETMRPRGTKKF